MAVLAIWAGLAHAVCLRCDNFAPVALKRVSADVLVPFATLIIFYIDFEYYLSDGKIFCTVFCHLT